MSSPNEPQDPSSVPEGQGAGNPPEGTPVPGPGGVPQDGRGRPVEPPPLPQHGQGQVPQHGAPTGQPGQWAQQPGQPTPQPGQPPVGGPYAQPYPAAPGQAYGYPKNNLAVWSLVLGIAGLFLCSIFTSIPGIIVGANARAAVARGEANNGSLANAGFWVSWIATILQVILGIVLIIVLASNGSWNDFPTNRYGY